MKLLDYLRKVVLTWTCLKQFSCYNVFSPTVFAECFPTFPPFPAGSIIPVLTSSQFGRLSTETNQKKLTDSPPVVKSEVFDLWKKYFNYIFPCTWRPYVQLLTVHDTGWGGGEVQKIQDYNTQNIQARSMNGTDKQPR